MFLSEGSTVLLFLLLLVLLLHSCWQKGWCDALLSPNPLSPSWQLTPWGSWFTIVCALHWTAGRVVGVLCWLAGRIGCCISKLETVLDVCWFAVVRGVTSNKVSDCQWESLPPAAATVPDEFVLPVSLPGCVRNELRASELFFANLTCLYGGHTCPVCDGIQCMCNSNLPAVNRQTCAQLAAPPPATKLPRCRPPRGLCAKAACCQNLMC